MTKHQPMEKPGIIKLGSVSGNNCQRHSVGQWLFKDTSAEGLSSQGEANLSPLILLFVEAAVGSKGYRGSVWEESGK